MPILGAVLDRAASERDAARAKAPRDQQAKSGTAAAADAIASVLEAVFDCP